MNDKLKEEMNEALGFHPDSETDFVAEIVRLRQESRDNFHALTKVEERKKWWMKKAEDIAKERGELFRAGENMAADFCQWCPNEMRGEVLLAWDTAAQPLRDMIASIKSGMPNA